MLPETLTFLTAIRRCTQFSKIIKPVTPRSLSSVTTAHLQFLLCRYSWVTGVTGLTDTGLLLPCHETGSIVTSFYNPVQADFNIAMLKNFASLTNTIYFKQLSTSDKSNCLIP